jgi:hypothetical protein
LLSWLLALLLSRSSLGVLFSFSPVGSIPYLTLVLIFINLLKPSGNFTYHQV